MPLSLRIISSPDGEPIPEWTVNFPDEGGSIGRAYGMTMQLSDASREISGTHALINRSSRGYQIMDVSTNGVYLNGATKPLGVNNQSTLNDGDVVNVGKYRLMVSCFTPEKAVAKASQQPGTQGADKQSPLNGWDEDPFGDVLPTAGVNTRSADEHKNSAPEQLDDFTMPEWDFTDPKEELEGIFEDPFVANEPVKSKGQGIPQNTWLGDDSFSDDPFGDDMLNTASVVIDEGQPFTDSSSLSPYSALESQQLMLLQLKQHDLMVQSAEMALERLLSDISPAELESFFDDFAPRRFWQKKANYWTLYKRYFTRQKENKEWQMKFKAYFSESLRIKQSMGDK
ncbi:FHA domain-containing protein [Moritella sp. 24]|uniref:type VI secretion system-associated FHA domain protein n=1 Tax=Moritella sp. 24 TaxID=2746230 RepID=UPI001BA9397D|nr:FHA domain-containing protein [Moritella sp. 24]QUM77366.1 FHA domain-containing protein [Moritella sp. 24]